MESKESRKLAIGIVIGSLVGATALHFLRKNHKPPVIKRVGRTIADFGQVLENCDFDPSDITTKIEEAVPSGKQIVGSVFDLVDLGMNIWKKIRNKG